MFQEFTGIEYLKIDIANNFGFDKLPWNERIKWFDHMEPKLEESIRFAEEPALFHAGVQAYRKAQKGEPSGYPISLDGTSSGLQILASLSGDEKAASLCNVIDTGNREDAYQSIYKTMQARIGEGGQISKDMVKQAVMTAFYGSTLVPREVFGEGDLLTAFYETVIEEAPGPWEINETLLSIWDSTRLLYEWVLPDNFHVKIKVMGRTKKNVHFLNEPFEVTYYENKPIENGKSLGANMVHSIDGMIVREMVRRCSHNPDSIFELTQAICKMQYGYSTHREKDQITLILWGHYLKSGFLSARILDHLDKDNLGLVDVDKIRELITSLPRKPFDLITIHDCFRCLPNYGNDLRRQYNRLLSELAKSELLGSLVSQMLGREVKINKIDPELHHKILEANYALS